MTAVHPLAIPVGKDLRRVHAVIAATRSAAEGLKADETGRVEIGRRPGVIYMRVSRNQLRRGLLIGEAIIREAERRGWGVQPIEKSYNHRAGVAAVVRGHAYAFELSEVTKRVPMDEKEAARWRRDNQWRLGSHPETRIPGKQVPADQLHLSFPHYQPGRANWKEGPRGLLEEKLGTVFAALEERADADDRRATVRQQERAEEERREENGAR